jgi:nicotinamide mononucleotide transporter
VPGWDGFTTAMSLAAIYGQTRKYVESWWLWILADLIYIPLYGYKHLWLTSGLYFVFLLLCVMGLREWSKALRVQNEPVSA